MISRNVDINKNRYLLSLKIVKKNIFIYVYIININKYILIKIYYVNVKYEWFSIVTLHLI